MNHLKKNIFKKKINIFIEIYKSIVKKLRKLTLKRIASRLSLKIIKYFHETFREHV